MQKLKQIKLKLGLESTDVIQSENWSDLSLSRW